MTTAGQVHQGALPRPSFSLAPKDTEAYGCFLRQNQYELATCPYDIVFFREDLSGQGSTTRIDFKRLHDWYDFQNATRVVAPPRVGAYFPFEGLAMYNTLAELDAGMASLYVKLPLFIQLLRGKPYLSDICIPSSYLVMMLQEEWRFPTEVLQTGPTWVPHVALSATSGSSMSKVLFDIEPAQVSMSEEGDETKGYARYTGDTSAAAAALPLRRIPYATDDFAARSNRGDIHDLLANINALGFRAWSCMPMAMLQNTDQNPEWTMWRAANLAVARAVSQSQVTPIVACGQPDLRFQAEIPPDVLVASAPGTANSGGAWHVLD